MTLSDWLIEYLTSAARIVSRFKVRGGKEGGGGGGGREKEI